MSCEKNGNQVSHSAGKLAGISVTAGKLGHMWGNTSARMARLTDTVTQNVGPNLAPVSNRALQVINLADRPSALAIKALPFIPLAHALTRCVEVKSALVGPRQGYEPALFVALKLNTAIKTAGDSVAPVVYGSPGSIAGNAGFLGTTNVWSAIGDLVKTEKQVLKVLAVAKIVSHVMANLAILTAELDGSRALIKKGGSAKEVRFSKTKLTPLLNKQDRLLHNVLTRSEGELITFKKRGQVYAWHRGTSTVQMPNPRTGDSENRVITHLQSIAIPATSYYFDRPLSDQEVADIVTGQGKIRPHQLDGYVGSVSAIENLTPVWVSTKRALILTRLHWPTANNNNEDTGWVLKQHKEVTLDEVIARHRSRKNGSSTMREVDSRFQATTENKPASQVKSPPPARGPVTVKQIPQPGGASEKVSSP